MRGTEFAELEPPSAVAMRGRFAQGGRQPGHPDADAQPTDLSTRIVVRYLGAALVQGSEMVAEPLSDSDYQALAAFRYALRRFLNFSTEAAVAVGLEAQQYQALLALRGRVARQLLTVGELAEELQIRHHSAVGLITRLAARGLVERRKGATDRRQVFIALTPRGRALLARLAAAHKAELKKAAPAFDILIRQIGHTVSEIAAPAVPSMKQLRHVGQRLKHSPDKRNADETPGQG